MVAGSAVVRACSSISVGLSGQGGGGLGCIPVVPMHPHLLGPRAGGAACSCDKTLASNCWVWKGGKSEEGYFF